MTDEDGSFVIFSGNKLWYTSKEGMENNICKPKTTRISSKIRNSAKPKKDIIYPIFENVKETDSYWISFFEDASIGKLPRNFKLVNNIFSYRVKNKIFEVKLGDEAEENIIIIKNFLFEQASIISPRDLEKRRLEEETKASINVSSEINSWSQIRSEKQQIILISMFVEKVTAKYGLDMEERKALIQQIKLAILAGYFNHSTIIVENNEIIEIQGLDYDKSRKKFIINTEMYKAPKTVKKVNEYTTMDTFGDTEEEHCISKKNLIKNWQKFLSNMNRKYK